MMSLAYWWSRSDWCSWWMLCACLRVTPRWIILFTRVTFAVIVRPMAGYLCDKVSIPVLSRRHGKKKSWHLIGIVLQVVSMPLLFSNCLVCSSEPSQWELIAYYGTINTLGGISIILIETAHLSLIPFIAKDQKETVKLNGLRFDNCLISIQLPNFNNSLYCRIWKSHLYICQAIYSWWNRELTLKCKLKC